MGVDGRSESVVTKLLRCTHAATEVDGLHHAARAKDPQHRVEVRVVRYDGFVQRVGQSLSTAHVQLEALKLNNPHTCT